MFLAAGVHRCTSLNLYLYLKVKRSASVLKELANLVKGRAGSATSFYRGKAGTSLEESNTAAKDTTDATKMVRKFFKCNSFLNAILMNGNFRGIESQLRHRL